MKVSNKAHLPAWFDYPQIQLALIEPHEIPSVVQLINEAYQYQDAVKGAPRTSVDGITDRAARSDLYVARHNEAPVACVYIEPIGQILHFGLLTVSPDWRGKRLAPAIIRAIEDYARHHRFARLELDYMSLAPWLRRYYEGYGFAATGEIVPWGEIDLIRMSKHLV